MLNNKEKNIFVIFLIQNDKGEVFGALLDCGLEANEKFVGTNASSVFQLKPKEAVYHGTDKNSSVLMVSSSSITIGDGDYGPAIWLDSEFDRGRSCACDTFDSPPLVSLREIDKKRTDFKAINVEIFILQ